MRLPGVVLAAVLTAAAIPGVAAAQPPADPPTWISAGGDSLAGAADLSDDGSQVAFQSYTDLTGAATTTTPPTPPPTSPPPPSPTSTEAPTPPSEDPSPTQTAVPRALPMASSYGQEGRQWQVYVRDRHRGATTLLSDPAAGDSTAPSISGSGRLVSWVQRSDTGAAVLVADRDPDADGVFDEPGERTVRRVTGTESDLRFQRVPGCSPPVGAPGSRSGPCGPQLSADGSTLAFPGWLGPSSPALELQARTRLLEGFARPWGDIIDFGPSAAPWDDERATVRLTAPGARPMQLRGVTIEGGDGAFRILESDCTGTIDSDRYCTVALAFEPDADSCPSNGGMHVHRAQLVTDATTPAGRAAYPVIADCWGGLPAITYFAAPRRAQAETETCPAPDLTGLRPRPVDDVHGRGLWYQVADAGPVQLGRSDLAALQVGPVEGSRVTFSPPADCSAQLVTPPPEQRLPGAERPAPCEAGSETLLRSCTAYVLLRPTGIRAEVGSLDLAGTVTRFVAEGQRSVVIARRDLAGTGDFAATEAPPPAVVSLDGEGNRIHGVEPSVSGDGRRVTFTSRVGATPQVYLHDTDARGDRSYQPGATELVSIPPPPPAPPPPQPQPPPPAAGSPSLSDDGNRVAFRSGDEVYLRDIAAAATVRVSEGFSLGHALSGDGSTVAFVTRRGDVDPGGLRARFLPDLAGGGITETLAADAADAGLPAVDRHGRHIGFDTDVGLVDADGNDTGDVYLTERLPQVDLDPDALDFGPLPLDTTSGPQEVTVSNAGPGPLVITGAPLTGPFTADNRCGEVVHRGQRCTIGVAFAPTVQGPGTGTLTVSDLDADYTAALTGSGTVGGTGPTVIDPDRDGLAAELVLDPPLAALGDAVVARGTEFPPDTDVVLTWRPGLGRTAVTSDPTGAFTVSVLVFPEDQLGERVLVGSAGDVTVESEPFLVVPPSGQPPGFHDRG